MKTDYIPEQGDIVWLSLDPTLGTEQKGRRPSVILTKKSYNKYGMCITVPITSQVKGHYLETKLPNGMKVQGVALINHARSHNWKEREISFVDNLPGDILEEIISKLTVIISI